MGCYVSGECFEVGILWSSWFPLLRPNVIGNVHLEAWQYAPGLLPAPCDLYLAHDSSPVRTTTATGAAAATAPGANLYSHQMRSKYQLDK